MGGDDTFVFGTSGNLNTYTGHLTVMGGGGADRMAGGAGAFVQSAHDLRLHEHRASRAEVERRPGLTGHPRGVETDAGIVEVPQEWLDPRGVNGTCRADGCPRSLFDVREAADAALEELGIDGGGDGGMGRDHDYLRTASSAGDLPDEVQAPEQPEETESGGKNSTSEPSA